MALERKSLTPAQAAKTIDELGFAQTLMFGKFGRARLSALPSRQYSIAQANTLDAELLGVTPWWLGALSSSIPRRVSSRPPPPIVVYKDASGCGQIGAALFDGPTSITSHARAPSWILRGFPYLKWKEAGPSSAPPPHSSSAPRARF